MPQGLMKEFIGKVCTIILFNESFGVQGKIVAVEENWRYDKRYIYCFR